MSSHDPVKKPSHYQFSKPCNEVRDVIEDRTLGYFKSSFPATQLYSYLNAIKYVLRAPYKNGWEDISKAHEVLGRMLSVRPNYKPASNKPAERGPGVAVTGSMIESANEKQVVDFRNRVKGVCNEWNKRRIEVLDNTRFEDRVSAFYGDKPGKAEDLKRSKVADLREAARAGWQVTGDALRESVDDAILKALMGRTRGKL